jgi:hypothetical protein
VPSPWLLPPFLTGNTQQHAHQQQESIHTPLSHCLPTPLTSLRPQRWMATAANILRLWMYRNHTVWCRHFHIPAVIFRQTRNSCTKQATRQQRAFAIGNRGCASLSRVEFSLRVVGPVHRAPYIAIRARFSAHQTHDANNPKKGKTTREPHCSSFCCSLQRKFIPISALDDTRKPSSVHQLAPFVTRFKVFDERPSCHGAISHSHSGRDPHATIDC